MRRRWNQAVLVAAILLSLPGVRALAQVGWEPLRPDPNRRSQGGDYYAYHPGLDCILLIEQSVTKGLPYSSCYYYPSGFSLNYLRDGVAFHRASNQLIAVNYASTARWSGTAWVTLATHNPALRVHRVAAHAGRGTVMVFGGTDQANLDNNNQLYEWDGVRWRLVPTTVRPPLAWDIGGEWIYMGMAYDPRRDKLVLCDYGYYDWNYSRMSVVLPRMWEWDAASGWVNVPVQGTSTQQASLYYDTRRGSLMRVDGTGLVSEWRGGPAWQSRLTASFQYVSQRGVWHPRHGRYYTDIYFPSMSPYYNGTYQTYHLGTIDEAGFESLGLGCPGALGQPSLGLTREWTRAWMGQSLSIDLTNLPQSTGLVAVGWSGRRTGGVNLPLGLAPYGMPGCSLRVAPDVIYAVSGSAGTATLTMPVPMNNALLGVAVYQQGFAFDPAANAAGLVASNSVRHTVGRL